MDDLLVGESRSWTYDLQTTSPNIYFLCIADWSREIDHLEVVAMMTAGLLTSN
jgi:hypothetical protein